MANTIDYASIFQAQLDEQMIPEMTSRAMEANAGQVQYTGGHSIKVLKMTLEGLGTYNRSTGFPSGDITTAWETFTFSMDRGKEFTLDAVDNEESFVDVAGQVMAQFQREKVAPEVDAYRYSKIFAYALASNKISRYTAVSDTIFEELVGDIRTIQDLIGEMEPLTIYMSFAAASVLDAADKITKRLDVSNFTAGGITTKTRSLDGIPIIRVPSIRFKSAYTFSATDGFSAATSASDINWIICANRAVLGIVKQDKVRTFSPEVNQSADAWKMQYRKYHDLFILDNKMSGIWVNHAGASAPALSATIAAGTGTGNTKATATAGTGNALGYILSDTAVPVYYLDLLADISGEVAPYTSAADIVATAGQYLTVFAYNTTTTRVVTADAPHLLVAGEISS